MKRLATVLAALALTAGAASADAAVGVRLPLEDLSVWRLDERTAWGLELTAYVSGLDNDDAPSFDARTGEFLGVSDRESRYYRVAVGVTRMRFRETGHAVKPFYFLRGRPSFSVGILNGDMTDRSWVLETTAGIGVAWQPFERVGVWIRKGLHLSYRHNESPDHRGLQIDSVFRSMYLGLQRAPQATVYFTW